MEAIPKVNTAIKMHNFLISISLLQGVDGDLLDWATIL